MSIFPPGSITAGIFLILSLLSGVWLARIGRPLNVVLMTTHKLISLGAVIFTGVAIYRVFGAAGISPTQWITVLVTGILFLTLFASGAVLSTGKVTKGALLIAHKSFPVLTVICFFLIFFHVTIGK
jgi:hypothetical protein